MKKLKWLFIAISLIAGLFGFLYTQNHWIEVTRLTIESDHLPEGFKGYRIVQISDLHSELFGENQSTLMCQIQKLNPDLVVITGDLDDSSRGEESVGLTLLEQLTAHYPVYFATGNHEAWSGNFTLLQKKIESTGVQVLRNESVTLQHNGDKITLIGIDDPAFTAESEETTRQNLEKALMEVNESNYQILLAHRPEVFTLYAEAGIDLTFSGHVHGGQFRIPLIGGLYGPNQGFFPEYDAGVYHEGDSSMVLSRGLGNSVIPQRLLNRPELILVELQ